MTLNVTELTVTLNVTGNLHPQDQNGCHNIANLHKLFILYWVVGVRKNYFSCYRNYPKFHQIFTHLYGKIFVFLVIGHFGGDDQQRFVSFFRPIVTFHGVVFRVPRRRRNVFKTETIESVFISTLKKRNINLFENSATKRNSKSDKLLRRKRDLRRIIPKKSELLRRLLHPLLSAAETVFP